MKKLLLGTVALAALAMGAPAIAADMAARPIARPVAFTNWTGCYVGGGAGTMYGHTSGFSTTGATTFPSNPALVVPPAGTQLSQGIDMTGVTFGGYGGCQFQFGVWVVGAEGDWWGNNKEGQAFAANGGPATVILPGGTALFDSFVWSVKERWYATARARLGYAVDKWLFYVTGGGAWVKIDSSEFCLNNPTVTGAQVLAGNACAGPLAASLLQSDTRTGWTVGGGVEYALPYNWSIRSEYLFIKIPSYTTFTPGCCNGLLVTSMPTNLTVADINNHVWRAGLTYRFGYVAAPAVTK